jgi:hypothetical protein
MERKPNWLRSAIVLVSSLIAEFDHAGICLGKARKAWAGPGPNVAKCSIRNWHLKSFETHCASGWAVPAPRLIENTLLPLASGSPVIERDNSPAGQRTY